MSKLSKRDYNNSRYPRPLPLPIPLLHISNKYYTPYEVGVSIYDTLSHIIKIGIIRKRAKINVVFDIFTDLSFKILDQNDMNFIWDNGFYGKGILSRSEPTWHNRMERKINDLLHSKLGNENNQENSIVFSEEVTKQRRLLRDLWKRERETYFQFEKDIKLKSINGEISENDKIILEIERERLSKLKDELTKGPKGINVNSDLFLSRTNTPLNSSYPGSANSSKQSLRMEDYDVIIDSKHIRNIEYLELDPCETLFLLQLGIINVNVNNKSINFKDLIKLLIETFGEIILNEYVVYYHYRTLGWCVKNGLKFSCDWVLYSRGPPFSHAEFSIKVINENDENGEYTGNDFIDFSAVSRVVSGVKKSLILCFIDGPNLQSDDWLKMWEKYLKDDDFFDLLNNFTISEINWKRWAPSRTRM